ncbi:MAG: hypothetical protein LBH75_08690 [Treponema sp.]|nr:hypothetical protein [Treponema sp.]
MPDYSAGLVPRTRNEREQKSRGLIVDLDAKNHARPYVPLDAAHLLSLLGRALLPSEPDLRFTRRMR